MHPLKSVRSAALGESVGCSIGMVCFGLCSLGAGIYWLEFQRDLVNRAPTSLNFGGLIFSGFVAFGVVLTGCGIVQARLALKLAKPQAWVPESSIQTGDTFHFVFDQKCLQDIHVNSIGIFLVFREDLEYDDDGGESTTAVVDRLVQQIKVPGRAYCAGESIHEEVTFQIPRRNMGLKHQYTDRPKLTVNTLWVVKVRLNLGKDNDVWREFEVDVVDVFDDSSNSIPDTQGKIFDVFLAENSLWASLRIKPVTDKLLPHLDVSQLGSVFAHPGTLLLERLPLDEAHSIKDQFAAVNVHVTIQPHEVD